jgi:hypothetical protein
MSLKSFDQLIGQFRKVLAAMPDKRTGRNKCYSMEDIGLGVVPFRVELLMSGSPHRC